MPSIPATAAIPGGHPFSFVEPGHPLRGDLERFWDSATRVPALSRLLVLDGAAPRQRSVLRLYPTGRARLKWLSVSVQRQTATGFSSVTLHYRASRRLLLVHELPHDPLLPALPALGGEVAEVLQYVPRRRFTFRAPSPRADIGKCVRPSDLGGAWMRLRFAVTGQAPKAEAKQPPPDAKPQVDETKAPPGGTNGAASATNDEAKTEAATGN